MKITTNQELYVAVKKNCEMLEREQLNIEATELRDALRISTLPGEILGEIRLVLGKIKQTETLPIEIINDVNNEIDYIRTALV